jgi:DNA polymerase
MQLLYTDFESFYSTEFSLRHLDPPSYILDQLFQLNCCSVARNSQPAFVLDRDEIGPFFNGLDPNDIIFVSHNAQFDASILSWRFGWRPKLICCTLSMSRTILNNKLKRHDLDSVAQHLQLPLPPKSDVLNKVRGMSREDIIANGLWDEYRAYCLFDNNKCRGIFEKLSPLLPDEEFLIHDQVLRMAVDPVLLADVTKLSEHLDDVRSRKEVMFARAMLMGIESKTDLMSNQRFAVILSNLGVDPPTKISPITGLRTFAFAKSDEAFQELREHDNPLVRDLVETRLGYKSTIEETRAARLLNIGQLHFPHHGDHVMPIALRIGAARTHRLGGDWKCNFQNMGRKSKIRDALRAPPGHVLVAADAAQIEARLLAWYCGQADLLELFRAGVDVYAAFASNLFGKPVTKATEPILRFLGKTAVLGCGYVCGPDKLILMVKALSALDGEPLVLTYQQSDEIIQGYRLLNNMIVWKWGWMRDSAIPQLAKGVNTYIEDGPIRFGYNEVTGPSNLKIFYPGLHYEDAQWWYDDAGTRNKLYNGKLIENVNQHMARVVVMQTAHRMIPIANDLGARFVLQAHDQLVYSVPERHAELLGSHLHTEMTREPKWAPGLPLATDVERGPTYGQLEKMQ